MIKSVGPLARLLTRSISSSVGSSAKRKMTNPAKSGIRLVLFDVFGVYLSVAAAMLR